MDPRPVRVRWEVATNETFTNIVKQGTTHAVPQLGHSVHLEVHGLLPHRWYFYRFHVGNATSPTGRTRTAPAFDELPEYERAAKQNPFVRWYNSNRGYVTCEVTPKTWTSHFRVTPFVDKPGSPILTKASFIIENGKPGAHQI